MDQGSTKRKPEEGLDDENHDVKRRKKFETWRDLEELIRARVVRGNYRRADEGPLDLFTDAWQKIWEDDLEKEHKKNFYGD